MPEDVSPVAGNRKTSLARIGKCLRSYHISESLTKDRNFADNVGITFHTPEEFFLHEQPREFTRAFDPSEYLPDFSAAEGT
jgi:hypothetical protein